MSLRFVFLIFELQLAHFYTTCYLSLFCVSATFGKFGFFCLIENKITFCEQACSYF